METPSTKNNLPQNGFALDAVRENTIDHGINLFSKEDILSAFEKILEVKNLFRRNKEVGLKEEMIRFAAPACKKSFLVFKQNKYITVPTENIAFFCVRYDSTIIVCFDKQEYFVNYSLEQLQHLLLEQDFFRLNRQYLISFNAVKEVEHYFARKLLVNLTVVAKEKLLVSKEKVSSFLHWLDNR